MVLPSLKLTVILHLKIWNTPGSLEIPDLESASFLAGRTLSF